MEPNSSGASQGAVARTRCKLVFVGDSGVGKTSIIKRYVHNTFENTYMSTIGIDFLSRTVTSGGRSIRLQLWDTAGQEKYRSLISNYVRDASGVMVVYDVTDRVTFASTAKWIEDIREAQGDGTCIFLVGNKIDLSDHEQIPFEEGERMAKQNNVGFMQVSAKTDGNIEALFQQFVAAISGSEGFERRNSEGKNSFAVTGARLSTSKSGRKCRGC